MLGELEANGRAVVFDMEAGAGTLLRMAEGAADVVLVVAEPTAKSIEAARRHAEVAAEKARVVVVANKLAEAGDAARIGEALAGHELVEVPEDPAIARAELEGRAPIDVAPDAPAVRALAELAGRLVGR